MPRRLSRDESRRRTREQLLRAAGELFAQQGVNGTSIEQIAEHAGYSRGAFYSNFGGKHELAAELLTQRTLREVEEVRALGAQAEPYEALRAWNRERARHLPEWLALRLELLLFVLRNPASAGAAAEREKIARAAHEQALARAFAAAGTQPPAPLPFLALIAHALEDGLLIQRLLTPDELPADVVVDAVRLLLTAWGAAPPHAPEGHRPAE